MDNRLEDVVGEITVDNSGGSLDYKVYNMPFMVGFGSVVMGPFIHYFTDKVYTLSLGKIVFKSILMGSVVGFGFKYLINPCLDIKLTFQQSVAAGSIGAFAGLNLVNYLLK